MLKPKYIKISAVLSALVLAGTVKAQVLLGGFQGAGDPTDAGWSDTQTGTGVPITSDPYSTFENAGVTNYSESLVCGGPGGYGHPTLELQLSPAQIAAFNTNSWITFTFSVPGWSGGGYSQIYSFVLNAPGYGYNSQSWTNAQEMGNTGGTTAGQDPNFYPNGSSSVQTMVVSINYSSATNAIIAGGESYLQMDWVFNNGGGAPTNIILNNVVLSSVPFGQSSAAPPVPAGQFIVDDFSANGVSPSNPTNDDYFNTAEDYSTGAITNVWTDWFGITMTDSWASGVSPGYAPTAGSMEVQWTWGGGSADDTGYANQVVMWEDGSSYGMGTFNIGTPYYTNFSCDIMFPSGDPVGPDNTFGQVQFGSYANGNGNAGNQDWFGGANYYVAVSNSEAGVWQHVSIPLNGNDPAEVAGQIGDMALHMTAGYNGDGNLTGLATCYIDNIEFTGPGTVVTIPAPKLQITKAIPALRIFAGSTANTYDRESLVTENTSQSWIGQSGASYSFSLLNNIPAGIGQTMLELIPTASETPGNGTYNNEYVDFQSSNGLWLVLAPYNASEVTATVEWKTNLANANPNQMVLTLTNSTIGTWKLTLTGNQTGSLTPPGGNPVSFSITDNTASVDFANPMVANFGLQPNSTTGEGEYEDWGSINVSGLGANDESENFTTETQEWTGSSGETPDGEFTASDSGQASSLVFVLPNYDRYWVNWTLPASAYTLVVGTNITTAVTNWINPTYYGNYYDTTPPRSVPSAEGPSDWELLSSYDLPTVDGNFQSSAPAINDPLAPDAYFILSTNTPNAFPITP